MFIIRKLRDDETDHEKLWLFLSIGGAILAAIWLHYNLPRPGCWLKETTNLPCPACGGTRAFSALIHGEFLRAARLNPLGLTFLLSVVAWDIYAAVVLIFRVPRIFLAQLSSRASWILRISISVAVLANWIWLVADKR
jgi:hypothetical protein